MPRTLPLALLVVALSLWACSETKEAVPDGDAESQLEQELADTDGEALSESDVWDYRAAWPAPVETWSNCPEKEAIGGQSLHEKAAYYDWIVPKLHQVPATAKGHESYSIVHSISCDAAIPTRIVADAALPSCKHALAENSGLWTSLYVAAEAFRYAATHDAEALAQLKRSLNGTYQQLKITGKSGLYARDMRDPSLPMQYCIEAEEPYASATDDNLKYERYVPPGQGMVGNSFVKVDTDGCFKTWDKTLNDGKGGWVKDGAHCTDTRFAGFCWQRNASKDEYAGHMFAAGIVAKLVDDPEVRAMAIDILGKVGHHLVDNAFWITDYDGRPTRYGSSNALSLDEIPGSNALQALAWIKEAAVATGSAELTATYEDCLLQLSGTKKCINQPFEKPKDYRLYLDSMGLAKGCDSNYDTISIATLNYFNLVWFEQDPTLRDTYRQKFRANTKGPDSAGRDLWNEADPFKNFIIVSSQERGKYEAAEMTKLVKDAVCSLKRFPTDNINRAKNSTSYPAWCDSPRHGSLTAEPVPIEERCNSVFEWWGDPNERESCAENLKAAEPPAGFLLPYWMGRYFGYISADL